MTATRASVHRLAPAKINLALAVGPPQPEPETNRRMHPIRSWMVTVDLCDELHLTRLEDDRISRYAILWHEEARRRSEIDWSVARDLAVRAHVTLEKHIARRLPVQMKLEKRIPVGGGLGGGSSDAAAALLAVNELFELGLTLDELAVIGRTLGADVPFLVHGGSAMVEGVGETITRQVDVPDLYAVLIFPDVQCPTGRVYELYDEMSAASSTDDWPSRAAAVNRLMTSALQRVDPASPFNDLAAPAMRIAPILQEHIAEIAKLADRPAHISGSGSSMFVICDDAMHAEALALAIETQLGLPSVAVQSMKATP